MQATFLVNFWSGKEKDFLGLLGLTTLTTEERGGKLGNGVTRVRVAENRKST